MDLDLPKQKIGGWIVTLDRQCTGRSSIAAARIFVWLSLVDPIGDLQAVDPHANPWARGDDRGGEPLLVVCVNDSRISPAENPSSTAVFWIAAITVFDAVLDLRLVPVHYVAWNAAKEHAGI